MLDLITMFAAVGAQSELDKVHKDTGVSSPLTSEAQEQVLLFSLAMFHAFFDWLCFTFFLRTI